MATIFISDLITRLWERRRDMMVRSLSVSEQLLERCEGSLLLVSCELRLYNSGMGSKRRPFTVDYYSVFPWRLELSPSLEYISGFIHLFFVRIAMFDIVFWGFHIIFFCVFIENTNNWMFPINNQNPRLIPKLSKCTWQNWIKSIGCNPIWQTN